MLFLTNFKRNIFNLLDRDSNGRYLIREYTSVDVLYNHTAVGRRCIGGNHV